MLTIGRFADATGLTAKALRHYDEIGLLVPARVDPDNGYRYYDTAQIEDAVAIRRLRALELPLGEIKILLEGDGDTVRDRLAAHGYRVAEEAWEKQLLHLELNALVEGGDEALTLKICDVPELRLAATIRHLQLVDPEGIAEMVQLARHRLAELGIEPAGPPTAVFRGGDGDGTHLVEVGYDVPEEFDGEDVLRVRRYPAATAATVEHTGHYDDLHVTSQRFIATVLGQGLRFGQPIRIEFVKYNERARLVWPLAVDGSAPA
jgi:DNA-binding transcriptional MerR regulator